MNAQKINFVPAPNLKDDWKSIMNALGVETEKVFPGIDNTGNTKLLQLMADLAISEEMTRILNFFVAQSAQEN